MHYIRKLILWVKGFWSKSRAPEPEEEPTPEPEYVYTPRKTFKQKMDEVAVDGNFTDMQGLLHSLDGAFERQKALIRSAPELRNQVAGLGILVVGDASHVWVTASTRKIDLVIGLPTYMCAECGECMSSRDENGEMKRPTFLMATKETRSPWVEPSRYGFHYEVMQVFTVDGKAFGEKFYIEVNPDTGELRQLRALKSKEISLPNKKSYTSRAWRYANEALLDDGGFWDSPAIQTFSALYSLWSSRERSTNIIVRKKNIKLIFTVPENNWKDFFRYRIKVRTPNGGTKPIYHAVKAHTRINGSSVRTHYRGLRNFTWNGYKVKITLPGKHGRGASSLGVPLTNQVGAKTPKGYVVFDNIVEEIADEYLEGNRPGQW